ncbi:MAG: DnaD domain protein [Clostridiales Family XIII bacterium]|jgi:DnaD/phage-associated family protein|nr:DnaD domain protein [Clostridiales Family XIII bacterium]
MRIFKYDAVNSLLEDTSVPNIFLELYLPHLSGDCVRVYLSAWLRSQQGQISSNESIAKTLGMNIEDVLAAWTELENEALIHRTYPNENDKLNFDVAFTDLRGSMFASGVKPGTGAKEGSPPQSPGRANRSKRLDDENIRNLFRDIEQATGRPFPAGDYEKISGFLNEYDIEPELIAKVYRYCVARGYHTSAAYVGGILREWYAKGIRTARDADEHIEAVDMRFGLYRKIMKALGLSPQALTEAEKTVFDIWLDDYAMSLDDILAAADKAAGKQNKFDYAKAIIENTQRRTNKAGATGAGTSRGKYYADKRRKNEADAQARREEVLGALPRVAGIEADISRLNMELASLAFSSGPRADKNLPAEITAKINALIAEKDAVLKSGGFAPDYMDVHYDCELCKDTGILDSGASCRCFENVKSAAQ